ncbi:hypothetical protein BST61_g1197 [Cercospora zeina]
MESSRSFIMNWPYLRKFTSDEGSDATEIDLVFVPGCGTRSTGQRLAVKWQSTFSRPGARVQSWTFEHRLPLDARFSWKALLAQGALLLQAIRKQRNQQSETRRPLFFIAHSLGGTIVKQALVLANQEHNLYQDVVTATLGLIFLGTPHSPSTMQAKLPLVLKHLTSELSKQSLAGLVASSRSIADLSTRFEDSGIRAAILSIYETIESRCKAETRFQRQRSVTIIDHSSAQLGIAHETCLGVQLQHGDLIDIMCQENVSIDDLHRWFRAPLGNAGQNMHARLPPVSAEDAILALSRDSIIPNRVAEADATEAAPTKPDQTRPTARVSTRGSNAPVINSAPGSADAGTLLSGHGVVRSDYVPVQVPDTFDMSSILQTFDASDYQAKLPCISINNMERNEHFFGRDEELRLLDRFLLPGNVSSDSARQKYVALCGMPGVGKTEIALEFVHSRRARFDAIFWIRADEKELLEFDLSQIPLQLELNKKSEAHYPVVNRELAKHWLANPNKRTEIAGGSVDKTKAHWLIVFDNADDINVLLPLKQVYGKGSILVTSRDVNAKTIFDSNSIGRDVAPFTDTEGGECLIKMGVNGSEEKACEIARTLGGLPLAIAQIAGVIRQQYLDMDDFLDLYLNDNERHGLLEELSDSQRETARGTIRSIWWRNVHKDSTMVLLELISFLDPGGVEEQLFLNSPKDITTPALYPRTKLAYFQARAELVRSALVNMRKLDDKGNMLSVHRLLRESVRSRMSPERQMQIFSAAVAMVYTSWPGVTPETLHKIALWGKRAKLYPHVIAFKNHYEGMHGENDKANADPRLAELLSQAGWWQYESGHPHFAKPFLDVALHIAEQLDRATDGVLTLLCDINFALAAASNAMNDHEACATHSQMFLKMKKEACLSSGGPDIGLALAYNECGIGRLLQGRGEEAEKLFNKSIRTYRSLTNFQEHMASFPVVNLGLLYWLENRLDEAYEMLLSGLRAREDKFGYMDTESFETGRFLHALGNVQFDRRQRLESESYHRRALQQYQSTIGLKHHRTADVCHKVAQHCVRREDHTSARKLLNEALSVWETHPESYRCEIARSTFLLSKSYFATDDEGPAVKFFQRAVELRRQVEHATAKPDSELREADFDALVTFWSK